MATSSGSGKFRQLAPEMDNAAFEQLLEAIEAEPVPERLLELARELQAELQKKRVGPRETLELATGSGLAAK